ncbi:hypothetical protein [Pseudoclavibacter helvolus]|uniref:hypothetical protein n=1 Tax=Pseudoclavibacter helvolus TaxID=255205 RepID=UPI0024AD2DC4|nr:hypothetical protein [Pseudoclavibacter helvolus]
MAVLQGLTTGWPPARESSPIAGSTGCAAIATAWTTGVVTIRQRASKELERGRRGGAASARLSAPTATGGTQW